MAALLSLLVLLGCGALIASPELRGFVSWHCWYLVAWLRDLCNRRRPAAS